MAAGTHRSLPGVHQGERGRDGSALFGVKAQHAVHTHVIVCVFLDDHDHFSLAPVARHGNGGVMYIFDQFTLLLVGLVGAV